jgi:hypothetical protein
MGISDIVLSDFVMSMLPPDWAHHRTVLFRPRMCPNIIRNGRPARAPRRLLFQGNSHPFTRPPKLFRMGQAQLDVVSHLSPGNLVTSLPPPPQKAIPLHSSSKRVIADPEMCLSPPLPEPIVETSQSGMSAGPSQCLATFHGSTLRQVFHSLIILQFVGNFNHELS